MLSPEERLREMLLSEPGSRIEGPTTEVLAIIFEAAWWILRSEMGDHPADQLAMRHLTMAHELLTQRGYVVRQYPDRTEGAGRPSLGDCRLTDTG